MTPEQIEKLQFSLLDLMAKEVERYTNGESSSVPIEKAQELLQSITYLIGAYLKTIPDLQTILEQLRNETMSVLFYRGLDVTAKNKKEAMLLMEQLQRNDRKLASIAYQDSIFEGIVKFFHDYNIEYGSHDIPGSIDYPLLVPMEEYLGVEFILRYLSLLCMEDSILNKFEADPINRLLHCFDREAEHMLINLCELVLINAIGCVMLKKDYTVLTLTKSDLVELQNILSGRNKEEVRSLLKESLSQLMEELELNEEQSSYLRVAIPELIERLWNNVNLKTLERFFIVVDHDWVILEEFYEGSPMEDDKLREFILLLNQQATLAAKVTLILEQVRSIIDLTLLLEECFYPEEYAKIYPLLGEEEIKVLKKSILLEAGSISLEDYEPQTEWQKQLLLYDC
jgi:hypothetical protein